MFINETVIFHANIDYDIPINLYFVYANRLFGENFLMDSIKLDKYSLKILDATPSSLKNFVNIRLDLLKIKAYSLVSAKGIPELDEVTLKRSFF